ncbi:MAG: winged helix-turn-helix transcriptional regulator [Candidatus Woesearchaeota archaeon]
MKLNEIDRKILYELDSDSRQKLSVISKKLKLSEQRIKYRLDRLIDNGIISQFISFIDITKLGYFPFRLYVQYNNVGPSKEKEIRDYLMNHPNIQWFGSLSGSWDIEIVLFAKNFFHYRMMMDDIMGRYGDHIRKRALSVAINNYYFKRRYLKPTDVTSTFKGIGIYGGEPDTYSIDDKDILILESLAKDARISLVDLADNIEATPNGVKDRVRRLKEKGILQEHTIVLDTDKIEYEFYKVLINLRNFNKEIESRIVSFCDKFPNIWFFIICDGEWNVEFELEVRENADMRKILMEFRNEFQDLVLNYTTLLVYQINKMSYFPAHIKKQSAKSN